MTPMPRLSIVLMAVLVIGIVGCEREQKGISEDLPATRATRARADAQAIASAVRQYQATLGALPESLDALLQAQTVSGVTGGPFLARIPAPPTGFTPYQYAKQDGITFTVTSTGGGITVTAP
jgi:type II secretion system (T2SS) protein G